MSWLSEHLAVMNGVSETQLTLSSVDIVSAMQLNRGPGKKKNKGRF